MEITNLFKRAAAEQLAPWAEITVDQMVGLFEAPRDPKLADIALPVPALLRYTKLKGKPADFAKKWSEDFKPDDCIVAAVQAGTYVNLKFNRPRFAAAVLKEVAQKKELFGGSELGQGKSVIVEFSSPNIAKPFHAGHLRSTIIGNFIRNIHRALGYDVTAINYLGDWGKQYGMLAIAFAKYGSEEELARDPIKHLFDVYVKINADAEVEGSDVNARAREYFVRMEQGDEEALSLWRKFRDMSILKYKQIYERLNVNFDVYSGESQVSGGMPKALRIMEERNLLSDSKGARVVDLEAFKLSKALITKTDGTTLYLTRDVSAADERHEKYKFDKMFYVVGSQQDLHFNQLFKILELMGYEWSSKCKHIHFGLVKGMSTRKGTVVFLEQILQEARETMLNVMKQNADKMSEVKDPEGVADILGISAVVIQDLSARRHKDYEFSWDRMTQIDGSTGPYLQYAHARMCSVERKAGVALNFDADASLLTEEAAHDLICQIARYPEVLLSAAEALEPCTLTSYLFQLAKAVSHGHSQLRVKDTEAPLAEARLLLFWAAKTVLANGLKMLGLIPLEAM